MKRRIICLQLTPLLWKGRCICFFPFQVPYQPVRGYAHARYSGLLTLDLSPSLSLILHLIEVCIHCFDICALASVLPQFSFPERALAWTWWWPPWSSFRTQGIISPALRNAVIRKRLAKVSHLAQGQTCLPGQPPSNDWSHKGYKYSSCPNLGQLCRAIWASEISMRSAEFTAETASQPSFLITVLQANFHLRSASQVLSTVTSPLWWPAAAKSLQSCPTLWDPIDGSPPGSPIPGILQARTLEWVAMSFSNAW